MLSAAASKSNSLQGEWPFPRDICCGIPPASSPWTADPHPCARAPPLWGSCTAVSPPLTALWMVSFQASLVLVFITLLLVFALCFSFPEAVFPLAVYLFISWACLCPFYQVHISICCSLLSLSWLLSCPHAPTFPQPAGDRPPPPGLCWLWKDHRHRDWEWRGRDLPWAIPAVGQGTALVWEMNPKGGSCFWAIWLCKR